MSMAFISPNISILTATMLAFPKQKYILTNTVTKLGILVRNLGMNVYFIADLIICWIISLKMLQHT